MRTLSVKNLYEKAFETFDFSGLWLQAMGKPETSGAWIIYGAEKNGKTWVALKLAEMLSQFKKVLYISAEEGTSKTFIDACKRAQVPANSKNLHFVEYEPMADVDFKLKVRRAPAVVFIDNCTFYNEELQGGAMFDLVRKQHPDKLFIFLAHADKGEPAGAVAKKVKKLAKIIIRVEGLTAFVSGRCPGGVITIDETKSALYWGQITS